MKCGHSVVPICVRRMRHFRYLRMRSTRTRSSAIIMERDEAFQLASSRVLPASIQAELDNTERYAIGNVVYNPAKPTIVSWRKQSVQFAQLDDGNPVGVKNIVAPESERLLSQLRTQSTLFSSTGRRETTKEFTIKLSDENQTLIKASFGAIYQSTSNLLGLLRSSGSNLLKADLGNPIVQRVVENGGQFYVISTVYEAERVEISVRIDDDSDHETHWNSGIIIYIHIHKVLATLALYYMPLVFFEVNKFHSVIPCLSILCGLFIP